MYVHLFHGICAKNQIEVILVISILTKLKPLSAKCYFINIYNTQSAHDNFEFKNTGSYLQNNLLVSSLPLPH